MIFIVNKPVDYLCEKKEGHKTIFDLDLPEGEFFCINTLSEGTEGLVVLSNGQPDAEKQNETTYDITIPKSLEKTAQKILQKGMIVKDVFYPGFVITNSSNRGKRCVVTIETATHTDTDIRGMFEAIGYQVLAMRCTKFGKFSLGTLGSGRWRSIGEK